MTFTEIKARIRESLNDLGVTFYSATDLDDSVQDAYNLILAKSKCNVKKSAGELWIANLSYYDFENNFTATDILGVIAIYNNVNTKFLRDDATLNQLSFLEDKFELRSGTPEFWVPIKHRRILVYPRYATAAGTYDLFYWGEAPTVVDSATPLIAADQVKLIEQYAIPDMLEQAEEFKKAESHWKEFFTNLEIYTERCKTLAQFDYLIRL